jgi:hypothetical protein
MRAATLLTLAALLAAFAWTADAKPAAKGPRLAVEPAGFDFGEALPGKTLTKEFSIRNFGDQELKIDNVSTSCGCTAALLDPKNTVLKPGASAPLRVEMRTASGPGRMLKSVLIRSNDPVKGSYELKLEATVVAPQ